MFSLHTKNRMIALVVTLFCCLVSLVAQSCSSVELLISVTNFTTDLVDCYHLKVAALSVFLIAYEKKFVCPSSLNFI